MLIREAPALAQAILADATGRRRPERAPGWHVTDLVGCLRKAWYARHGYPSPPDPDLDAIFLLGESHHLLLQPQKGSELGVTIHTPGGLIHGTVDIYLPTSLLFHRVTEVKSTRYADDKDPAYSMPHYVDQLASYCLALGTTEGQLLVWHLMDTPPILRAWEITFTEEELEAWGYELERRYNLLECASEPPLEEHYTRECRTCPFKKRRGGVGPCRGGEGRPSPFFMPRNPPAWMVRGDEEPPLT